MRNGGIAFLLSVLLHGLIAAGIAVYIGYAPAPDELAKLDLTSVDLSFAETPDEAAQADSASAPMSPATPPKPTEPDLPPLFESAQAVEPMLPKTATAELPSPEAAPAQVETPRASSSSPQAPSAPAVAPRQAKVDAPPKLRRNIRPDYPKEARQRGEQGDVTLEIDVNAQGCVDDVRVAVTSGFPLLDEAAIRAVRAARFVPAGSGGRAVSSTARLTLDFRLK